MRTATSSLGEPVTRVIVMLRICGFGAVNQVS